MRATYRALRVSKVTRSSADAQIFGIDVMWLLQQAHCFGMCSAPVCVVYSESPCLLPKSLSTTYWVTGGVSDGGVSYSPGLLLRARAHGLAQVYDIWPC